MTNPTKEIDKIDNYNTQFNTTFTESQMYCLYTNSMKTFIDKSSSSSVHEFFTFLENEEKYKELFTCSTLKKELPSIDFTKDMLVLGFTNKCRNVDGIRQYLVNEDNGILTINVVTKGQREGGMGVGFITKVKKADKDNIRVKFLYNYTN
ncbi:hypothetical protein GCM10027035_28910 [Emticicia sediminis]